MSKTQKSKPTKPKRGAPFKGTVRTMPARYTEDDVARAQALGEKGPMSTSAVARFCHRIGLTVLEAVYAEPDGRKTAKLLRLCGVKHRPIDKRSERHRDAAVRNLEALVESYESVASASTTRNDYGP